MIRSKMIIFLESSNDIIFNNIRFNHYLWSLLIIIETKMGINKKNKFHDNVQGTITMSLDGFPRKRPLVREMKAFLVQWYTNFMLARNLSRDDAHLCIDRILASQQACIKFDSHNISLSVMFYWRRKRCCYAAQNLMKGILLFWMKVKSII